MFSSCHLDPELSVFIRATERGRMLIAWLYRAVHLFLTFRLFNWVFLVVCGILFGVVPISEIKTWPHSDILPWRTTTYAIWPLIALWHWLISSSWGHDCMRSLLSPDLLRRPVAKPWVPAAASSLFHWQVQFWRSSALNILSDYQRDRDYIVLLSLQGFWLWLHLHFISVCPRQTTYCSVCVWVFMCVNACVCIQHFPAY